MLAQRISVEPLVEPGTVPGYGPIFNPGLAVVDGRFHLFARGVREGYAPNPDRSGPRFTDYRSDILVFVSEDGRRYRFDKILAAVSDGRYGFEDPRVQLVDGVHWMTYTDLPDPASGRPWQIGLAPLSFDGDGFEFSEDDAVVVGPEGLPNKDAVLFQLTDGRLAMLHRIAPDIQLAVFDSVGDLIEPPDGYWDDHLAHLDDHVVIRPRRRGHKVGAGAPPVPTDDGLLLFFHERDLEGVYTAEVALLDPDTGRALARLPEPLLMPELGWERTGDVNDVVFVQGAHRLDDGDIYLTYGAADRAVGAAVVSEDALLAALRSP